MQAVAQLGDVDVYTSAFRPMRNTISGATGRTLMKLLVHSDSGRVVVGLPVCRLMKAASAARPSRRLFLPSLLYTVATRAPRACR